MRSPRRVDSGTSLPPPTLPSQSSVSFDSDEEWLAHEQQRREKAELREQRERDRHKATQDRLLRDRAFREEERLRQAEHQQKEQEAWDRAAQRRKMRQQEEDGVGPQWGWEVCVETTQQQRLSKNPST